MDREIANWQVVNRNHPINRDLVGEWAVLPGKRQGSSFVDLVGRNNASLVNSPAWASGLGRPGGSGFLFLQSSSSQYASVGDPSVLQITGPITVACWYKVATVIAGSVQLVAKDKDTGGRAYTLDLYDSVVTADSGVRFYINGGSGAGLNIAREGRRPVSGDCRFAVGTYDGTTVRVYANGISGTASSSADASIPTATANVLFGRREYASFEDNFDGGLDDIMIFRRALSAAEVMSLYKETLSGNRNRWNWLSRPIVSSQSSQATANLFMRHYQQLGAAG